MFAQGFVAVLGNTDLARMSRKWGMILISDQKNKKVIFVCIMLNQKLVFSKSDSQSE